MTFFNLPDNEMGTQMQKRIAELEKANQELRAENIVLKMEVSKRKMAEEALQESEKRYRMLHESMRDAFAQVSMDGRIIEFNDLYCTMLGYTPEEMRRLTYKELTPERWHAFEDCIIREQVIPRGYSDIYEKEYLRKDGTIIPVELRTILSRDSSDQPNGMWAVVRDVTDRKRTEEALKKAHQNLENLVKERTAELEEAYYSLKESKESLAEAQKMAHIGNWNWDLITGEVYWSEELYCIFRRDPKKLAPSYKEYLSYIHPDDRAYFDSIVRKPGNNKPHSIDHRIILDDGVERIVNIHAEVVFDERNIPIRVKGIVQDITERKKVEESLRESEEKYRNIVETANEGILIINDKAIITYANKKIVDMFGYSLKEGIGRPIWGFISEESKTVAKQNLESRQKGINGSYELKLMRKDGSPLWAYINAKSLFDKDGRFMGSLSMLTDITKRREAEEALINIETARKKEIHHRIKNNLQVISSLLDLQAEQFRNRDNIKDSEVLEAFRESQDRVTSMALIHEELYKGEEFETINFSPYIQELAKNLLKTYSLGNTEITLSIDLEENIFLDMDTAVPLGMIVNELVSNSFKHAFTGRDKGEIRIKLSREESTEFESEECESTILTLKISDNGVGIPENLNIEDIEDIDSLGIQLLASLVNQLNGEFKLKRNNGTEFTMKFAVIDRDNPASNPAIN